MPTDRLSATFSALADPTRRAILARLALGETSVSKLAKPFEMSLPAVSKHLKVLERAGLIARGARRADAALQDRSRRAEGGRRLARRISPALGATARPARRLSARRCKRKGAANQGRRNVGAKNSIDLDSDPRSIIGTRVFDAPRELVFSAFTDPKHLAQWWGPDGFTTTTLGLRLPARRRLALRHARAGRPRLPEPHHLR